MMGSRLGYRPYVRRRHPVAKAGLILTTAAMLLIGLASLIVAAAIVVIAWLVSHLPT